MWQKIVVTTEPATATSPGAIAEGSFSVENGKVRVRNDRGKLVGSAELVAGDNPAVIARRLLKRGRAQSDFYSPIRYPPPSSIV
jgi:hypothetical protein